MKHQKRKTTRRWHVLALCLCVAFSSAAAFISSAEEAAVTGGICAHHTEHTPECGYAADISGSSCSFTCPVCSVQDGAQKDEVTENKAPQKRSSARTVPEEITENGIHYQLDASTGTATVTGGEATGGNLTIPASVTAAAQEFQVTAIADYAFASLSAEKITLTLPEGLQTIGAELLADPYCRYRPGTDSRCLRIPVPGAKKTHASQKVILRYMCPFVQQMSERG